MILLHPLILAVLLLDGLSAVIFLLVSITSFRVLLDWNPGTASRGQIKLEQASELAEYQVVWVLLMQILVSVLLVVSVSNDLPDMVPGAMCGTGVIQAGTDWGWRPFFTRYLLLMMLSICTGFSSLGRTSKQRDLTVAGAKIFLVAFPVFLIAVSASFVFYTSLDVHKPVDCCAVVYDAFSPGKSPDELWNLPEQYLLVIFGLLSAAVGITGFLCAAGYAGRRRFPGPLFTVLANLWVIAASAALIRCFSAYYYRVLHHHCPWCLFLKDHYFSGYPLWGTLMAVSLVSTRVWMGYSVGKRFPELREHGYNSAQRAVRFCLFLFVAFLVMTVGPAVVWRIRNGVWLI